MLDSLPATYLGTLTASTNDVERPLVKGGPSGTRSVATVTKAAFEGPNISATMPDGIAAGDWLTVRADGSFSLDVRLSLRTDDGADIYVSYVGVGVRTDDGVTIRTSPRFETGDEKYAWLNNAFTVGMGRLTEDGVAYDVYQIS